MAECFIYGQSGENSKVSNLTNVSLYTNTTSCNILSGEGWISGFDSEQKYIRTTNPISLKDVNSWKICVHFKCRNISYTVAQALIGSEIDFFLFPSIEVKYNGTIWCGYTTIGTAWEGDVLLEKVITTNTEYYLTYQWDSVNSTIAIVELYDVDKNLITSYTLDVNGAFYNAGEQNITLGGVAESSKHYAKYVDICLIDTYIDINDEIVFGNKTDM